MKRTEFAVVYAKRRKAVTRRLTWDDVAAAYDAGLRHALAITQPQRNQMAQVFRLLHAANREVAGK